LHPTLFLACLHCFYCLLVSFSFFPGWRLVCPGGYVALAQACLWEYHVQRSSPGPRLPKSSGHQRMVARGALLVSPFNVKWRFSAPAGCVEGSKLCLFSVIMPAKCVSSISPRFHYRRLIFCFLPLGILPCMLFHSFFWSFPYHG
jgi:hypothetical protein